MSRLQLILPFLWISCLTAQGQCDILQDTHGQVLTICDEYNSPGSQGMIASHKQVTYLGSQYMTFPILQKGTVRIDTAGKEIACGLAYDLVANKVLCLFAGRSTTSTLVPYSFTINGVEFTRQLNNLSGVDYQLYTTVLHRGETKLLKSLSSQLVLGSISNGYEKGNSFAGAYHTKEKYYIRKGNTRPELIELSKASVLSILYEQAEDIGSTLPNNPLTVKDVSRALSRYDSLQAVAKMDKPPLSFEPLFTQVLHNQLVYPGQAWAAGIYGRVYLGFDVDESGLVKNVAVLSPNNIGFGLDYAARQGVEKVFRLPPVYAGHYVLPVAFTFTNLQEKSGPHWPLNTLSTERLDGRTLLEEFVVPIVVSKPVNDAREVWGYYK